MDPVKLLLYVIEYIALVSRYCYCKVTLVVSDSVRPHRQQPNRLPVSGFFQARTLEWGAIAFSG